MDTTTTTLKLPQGDQPQIILEGAHSPRILLKPMRKIAVPVLVVPDNLRPSPSCSHSRLGCDRPPWARGDKVQGEVHHLISLLLPEAFAYCITTSKPMWIQRFPVSPQGGFPQLLGFSLVDRVQGSMLQLLTSDHRVSCRARYKCAFSKGPLWVPRSF